MKKYKPKIIIAIIIIVFTAAIVHNQNQRKKAHDIVCSPDWRFGVRDKYGSLFISTPVFQTYERALEFREWSINYDKHPPEVFENIKWKDCE